MSYRVLALLVGSILLSSAAAGCSGRNPQGRRAISGSVTLDGEAIEQGSIRFDGGRGRIGTGALVEKGRYDIPVAKGLPPGKYKVMIFATKPGAGQPAADALPGEPAPPAGELIPPEYNVNSDKFIEVTEEGATRFDFDIRTQP